MENTRTQKNKLHHDFCNCVIISWKLCLFLSYQHPMQRGGSHIAPPLLLRTERLKNHTGTSSYRSMQGRSKPLETWGHRDFSQLIVVEKQRVFSQEVPLDWSLYLKTRKCFTQLQRHHSFNTLGFFLTLEFLFSTFMRACFEFVGAKN